MLRRLRPLSAILSVLLVACFLITPARGHAAALAALSEIESINLLKTYGIVKGDPSGNLLLDERLTRAQAAALFVRSMGAEDLAKMVTDAVPYTDAQGHWAAGEITMATRLNLMKGDGDGTFRPESEITYAEVLTVLLRIVQREPQGPWDRNVIMSTAAQLGFAPDGVAPTDPAIRRKIFFSLGNALSQVTLPTGKTPLQSYVDPFPPKISLTQSSITTSDPRVVISGTATDAIGVTVNGQTTPVVANGQFTATVDVAVGTSQVPVTAVDAAGNTAAATVTVERKAAITRIEVKGPPAIKAGTSTKLEIHAYDSQNKETGLDGIQVSLSGNVATFDLSSKTLQAGAQLGHGVLTLTAGTARAVYAFDVATTSDQGEKLQIADINGGNAPAPGKDATVKVQVLGSDGKLVTADNFRNVSLTVDGLTGLTITPHVATTVAGVATFTINGSAQGSGTLTASSTGLDSDSEPVQVLSSPRVVLTAAPSTLKPDGTSAATIRATLENDAGQSVRNDSGSDIEINLTAADSEGILTSSSLVIRQGAYTSYNTATYQAGINATTEVISGNVTSLPKYPVQNLSIPVQGDLQGAKLIITGPTANQTPNGAGATLYVKVVSANNSVITTGSYAFQLTVTTSNNEPLVNGLPEGVDVVLSGSSYRPVSTTPADPNYIVGRTYQGIATVKLTYDKSGTVRVTPKLVQGTLEAYNNTTGFGPGASSLAMTVQSSSFIFAGTPASIQLTADSALGADLPGAVASTARSILIRARVLDASGAPIPGNRSEITITRTAAGTGISRLSETTGTSLKKTATDGEADFTLQTTATPGFDIYTASSGTLPTANITVSVRNAKPDAPIIAAVRGLREGSRTPENGFIAPDDDYMEIQLEPQFPPNDGEPTNWVTAKVFRKGESSPFFTSSAFDLNVMAPTIRIPKSKLTKYGSYCYQVSINNTAVGDTDRSLETPACVAVNATYNTGYRLLSAQYDAASGKLALSTSGLATSGAINAQHLFIVKGDDRLSLGSGDVSVVSLGSSAVVLQLGALADQITPDRFNGAVTVQAEDGWYKSQDGSQIAKADTDNTILPMGNITDAALDPGTKRLYINGIGFKQGALALDQVSLSNGTDSVPLRPGTTSTTDQTTSYTDTQIIMTLSQQTVDAIGALTGPDLTISAGLGWLKTGSGTATYKSGAITARPVYVQVTVTKAPYDSATDTLTITGSGFTGATLDPTKLAFKYSRMTGPDWRPSNSAQVTVVSDTQITVTFSPTEAQAFETKFAGRNVYLNTDPGWLVDQNGRQAAPLTLNSIWFYVSR